MRAAPGDRIILAGEQVDHPTRAGEVLDSSPDGGPPYTVRWDDGHTSTLFPGPGSVLRVLDAPTRPPAAREEAAAAPGVLREWTVRVTIFERGDDTTATVALLADDPEALTARGTSRRGRDDPADAHIGDEVAVARALRHLADQLLASAEHEIEASTGEHDVLVRSV